MTIATASTHAPAVRQHGGGRTRRVLLTQQPSGRPTRSTGGEIKSLCCAAAGIIALATRPCGAHAYPLTGVRRAAHPAAPLRSTPRPHAQPVKGYTPHPDDTEWPTVRHVSTAIAWHNDSPDCQGHTRPVSQENDQ